MSMNEALTMETVDYIAIRRLQSAYGDIVTRRAWEELERIFLPDTDIVIDQQAGEPLVLNGPAALGEFIGTNIAHMDYFQFVILNTVIDLDGDAATARMYINEIRHASSNGHTMAYGLYRDRYCKIEGKWWFAHRRYRSMARTRVEDYSVFPMTPEEFVV